MKNPSKIISSGSRSGRFPKFNQCFLVPGPYSQQWHCPAGKFSWRTGQV